MLSLSPAADRTCGHSVTNARPPLQSDTTGRDQGIAISACTLRLHRLGDRRLAENYHSSRRLLARAIAAGATADLGIPALDRDAGGVVRIHGRAPRSYALFVPVVLLVKD